MSNRDLVKVKAILTQDVKLKGVEVSFPKGKEIDLDPENMIGYADKVHFFITKEEFKILYMN